MAKQHKIKRSRGGGKSSYRARPHPLTVLVTILVVAGLVFVGMSIYQPVFDFITGNFTRERVENSEPEEISQPEEPEPEPEDLLPDTVEGLRAVYVPHATVSDSAAFAAFLDTLRGSDINAVMVDIKNENGTVLFDTGNRNAADWGVVAENAFVLQQVTAALEQRDLHLIVRMTAFRDEPAARADEGLRGIRYGDSATQMWLDDYPGVGKPWMSPYSAEARQYIGELALECAEAGAAMVVLQDYRFPDASIEPSANLGDTGGVSRAERLRTFAEELQEQLTETGTRLAVYYATTAFGQEVGNEYRYGGGPEGAIGSELLVGLLPYQFSANYSADGLEIAVPLDDPAATVRAALQYVQGKLTGAVHVVALLQGGSEDAAGGYTRETVDAQIAAAQALGCDEYILYCTDPASYLIQ